MEKTKQVILSVKDLVTNFYTYEGVVKALEGVSFDVFLGETLGIVGETGCGKSVTVRSIARLIESPGKIEGGEVIFRSKELFKDLLQLDKEEMRALRGSEIAMVFQDPMTFLNPVLTIGLQIREVIEMHQDTHEISREEMIKFLEYEITRKQDKAVKKELKAIRRNDVDASLSKNDIDNINSVILATESIKLLLSEIEEYITSNEEKVKLTTRQQNRYLDYKSVDILKLVRMPDPEKILKQYPHELSGGMRQRAMIAMALSCQPKLLIADEATTALDVTIQAQILALINELKEEIGSSILIITHDLGVVAETCTRVIVMYAGSAIEIADTIELFSNPIHPYTKGLLNAIPKIHLDQNKLQIIEGTVPNLVTPPKGCRFHPRCPLSESGLCDIAKPKQVEIRPGHYISCHVMARDYN